MINTDPSIKQLNPINIAWNKSYSGLMAIGLFSIFINLLRLVVPMYILQILDRVVASRSLETLFMLTIITLTAIIFSVLLEVIRRRMLMFWGNWIERFFGHALFVAAGLKNSNHYGKKVSSSLRDVRIIRSFVAGEGFTAWIDLIWAPIFIGLVFLISPQLGYILLGSSIIALILGKLNERMTRDSRDSSYLAGKDDQDWVAAVERHSETVGSLNIVNNFAERWYNSAFIRLNKGIQTRTLNIYFFAAIRITGRFLRVSIFGFGIWLVIQQVLTLGALIAASVLSRTAFLLVRSAMVKWREMVAAKKSYGRMKDLLKKDHTSPISIPNSEHPVPLFIEKISYRYPQQTKSIFRNINLIVNPGEVLFVIGSSAVGKTTFSRLVSGLISPRSGNIRLGDVHIFQLQQNSIIQGIGSLPQDTTLFRGTVRENIASMSIGDIDKVIKAAKLAGIHNTILALPKGYDTIIVEYEPLLSSGQRKAIALARAFYGSPPLIILDEPIPHLDKSTRSVLFNTIKQLKSEGTIIIITTQSRVPSKYADKVILFDEQKHKLLLTLEEFSVLRNSYMRKENRKKSK